jgi:hypothetical protein
MKKFLSVFFLIIIFMFIRSDHIKANSAEPPMLWILIPGTYDTIEGVLVVDSIVIHGWVNENKTESYIRFYYSSIPDFNRQEPIDGSDAVFFITLDNKQYMIKADIRASGYNDLYTFDVDSLALIKGKTWVRDATLVSVRLFSTLILEALVFFMLGYRHRRTWILFLLVNLLTQGFLNIWLNSDMPQNVYMLFVLMVAEAVIIVVEEAVLLFTVKEGKIPKLFVTILLANLLSLFLGGWFIVNMPL